MTAERDGFEIVELKGDGETVHFVPCTSDSDTQRERVLTGLLTNMNLEKYYVRDTREQVEP